jgi:hypothetical protein
VTYVEAVLEADRPCRIRLETRFDGSIWPPRTNGEIPDNWDTDGVTLEVDVGRTAIGFATPAVTSERPVEIVRSEPRRSPEDEIDEWIERIEARLETAESLAAVDDVATAAEAIDAVGGLAAVETLAGDVDRDRRIARRLSFVPDELCERLEAIEIPTAAFATIAGENRRNSPVEHRATAPRDGIGNSDLPR